MIEPTISCPSCKVEIKITEALARPFIESERGKIETAVQQRATALDKREQDITDQSTKLKKLQEELQARSREIHNAVAERVAVERKRIEVEAAQSAAAIYATRLQETQNEIEKKDAKLAEAQKAELEARQQRSALQEEKRQIELTIARRLDEEREKIRESVKQEQEEQARKKLEEKDRLIEEVKKQARSAAETELETVKKALAEKEAKLAQAQEAELQARRDRIALEDAKRELELTVNRRMDEERQKIRESTRREDDEQYRLKLGEKDKLVEDMKKQIDELRRKSEQGSQKLQGDVQQLNLESVLRSKFPHDIFEPVANGQPGGDLLQRVVGNNGLVCGTILWESKNTKKWSDSWLPKIRDDQRNEKAELAAIMSEILPPGLHTFELISGVWITSPACVASVAAALRLILLQTAAARQAMEGLQGKSQRVYDYLTGQEFRQRVGAIVESIMGLQSDLATEKRAMNKSWAKREKHLDRLMLGTSGIYGDLQGIIGSSLAEIEGLDFPMVEPPKTSEALDSVIQNKELPFTTMKPEADDETLCNVD